jgi:hypothetical protein
MNLTLPTFQYRTGFMAGLLVMIMSVQTTLGASLFGEHSCQSWQGLGHVEKRAWANAFLAPLSLTLKGLQKSKEDKYNDDPKADEAAIMSIDAFCLRHPDLGAADGAGHHLKKLFEIPAN